MLSPLPFGVDLVLLNYYGPIFDDTGPLNKIYDLLINAQGTILMGGDFNFIQDLGLDTSNKGKKQLKPKTARLLRTTKEDFALVDPWRLDHIGLAQFTCFSARYKTASWLNAQVRADTGDRL